MAVCHSHGCWLCVQSVASALVVCNPTGYTAARLVGGALREAGTTRLVLAVPVCPRQAEAGLQALYDEIVAIDRPLARRDLRWHYIDLDSIDEAEAQRQLDAR